MFTLKLGQTRDQPAHRKGRKGGYVKQSAGLNTASQARGSSRESIERGAGFGKKIGPGPGRHCVAARAQEEFGAEPVLEQSNLSADCSMGHVQLFRSAGKAAEPSGGLEGLDCIQRRQACTGHAMSFPDMDPSEQVVCHQTVMMPNDRRTCLRTLVELPHARWNGCWIAKHHDDHRSFDRDRPRGPSRPRPSARALGCLRAHALHDGLTDTLYLLLPILQTEFALSYAAIGILRALYAGAMAGLQVPTAKMTQWLGGARMLAAGTAVAAIAYLGLGLSTSCAMLAVALVIGGIGSSTQHPIASTLVAGAYSGQRSRGALGTYNFAGDLGKMALPSIAAGLIMVMSWRSTATTLS